MDSERNQMPQIGRTESRVDNRAERAALRTRLAEERTFNAWLRSGLTMMAFSLAISRLIALDPSWPPDLLSFSFFIVGALLIVLGYRLYSQAAAGSIDPDLNRKPSPVPAAYVILVIGTTAISLTLFLLNY